MFQPGNAAYQQALMQQLGTQTYVPVSCEYGGSQPTTTTAATAATNALPPENSVPRTTTASPTVTDISASTNNTTSPPTSNSSTTSTTSSSALVPVNASKDSVSMASSSQTLTLARHPNHVVASPALNNMFSYAGYSLNNKSMRHALRGPTMYNHSAQHAPTVGVSPYAYSQPPPTAQHIGYVNNTGSNVSVAGMMPYASQAPSFVSPAGMAAAAAASGLHGVHAAYSGFHPGVAPGSTVQASPQFVYPHLPYMSMVPQPAAAAQYSPWAAAAAAQAAAVAAAAAAAGTTEQPYKKLKTV